MPADYPVPPVTRDHVEAAPRRVRAMLAGHTVVDTVHARYVWEWPPYPQYYFPLDDVTAGVLVDDGKSHGTTRGPAHLHTVRVGDVERVGAARVFGADAIEGVANTVRFDWAALDAWYEEDEQVFVHPRSPYARVDALRSTRHVRVSSTVCCSPSRRAPVFVFETGLPTRYYLDRTERRLQPPRALGHRNGVPVQGPDHGLLVGAHRRRRPTRTSPGPTTSPRPPCCRSPALVSFYNEKVDISLDGVEVPRPHTHFS